MVRIRPHVNPLKSQFLGRHVDAMTFPAGSTVEVELGCAEAWFLFERARLAPEHLYVGLEIREELVGPVNERARREGLPIQSVFCNVNIDLPFLLGDASVSTLYVNFPDPWFKKKHHKRRVIDEDLAGELARVLKPGAQLFFQSDVFELALDAMAVLEEEPRLCNVLGPWTFWKRPNPFGARSRREVGCEEEGAPVWRMMYLR
jgi:tRNA (guanine-N7-)-methyltransferase